MIDATPAQRAEAAAVFLRSRRVTIPPLSAASYAVDAAMPYGRLRLAKAAPMA